MPPFFESFLNGLKDAGNEVYCYQTKKTTGRGFENEIPENYLDIVRSFDPELCIFFNNNFWDISDIVDCPIIIYDVDSPLEWQLIDNIKENTDRYRFVYNQTKSRDLLSEEFGIQDHQCRYIPFFSEIRSDENAEYKRNIAFLGTNWSWKGYNFLNGFIRKNPSASDIEKAIEVINEYTKYPFKPSHEIYYKLENCPHDRINLGDLRRCAIEISGYRRIQYLQAVADLGLEIRGNFWTIDMMNYYPEVLSCVRSEQIWTKADSEELYNTSKIAMNTKHIQAENGFSFRVCDIMASNACLITERCNDLVTLFPEVDIPTFESPAEARELCKKLIENENMRLEITAAAHEAIDKRFRFKNVLEALEDFTDMTLRSEEEGSLWIFPESEEHLKQLNSPKPISESAEISAAPKKDKNAITPSKLRYYNTIGKHLGYDPYNKFPKSMIYLGKLPVMKIMQTTPTRKELYMGIFPIISYNTVGKKKVVKNLFFEKLGRMFKKIGEKFRNRKKKIKAAAQKTNTPKLIFNNRAHIARLREKLENGEKISVCLFVSRINCWMFEELYRVLQESGKFEPIVVVKPFMSRGKEYMIECMESTYEALIEKGYDPIKGYDAETDTYFDLRENIDPDILFYTKFWKPHFHDNFYINKFRDRLNLLIDYGYNVSDHKEALNFDLQNSVDMYFYYSDLQKNMVSKYMRNKGKNVVITGAPKLETFFDPEYIPTDPWKPQDKPKKRIIWAPHHEDKTKATMYQLDAFYDLYDVMLEIAEKYKDTVQFAFKPHPILKVKLYRYWGESATDKYYQKWADLENGQFEDGEYIDLFLTSDAMILDCLSFIAEYTATNKPALFTETSTSRVLLNDTGSAIYEYMYHAKDDLKKEICSFIDNVVIGGEDTLAEGRTEFIKEHMLPPNGKTACENIYDSICSYITNGGITE